jgi:hypothetical protein
MTASGPSTRENPFRIQRLMYKRILLPTDGVKGPKRLRRPVALEAEGDRGSFTKIVHADRAGTSG